jgi:hypothetical protein
MDTNSWVDERRAASTRRQRPRPQCSIRVNASSDGSLGSKDPPIPTDLFVEATAPDGETAVWFDDWWWMECLSRWKNDPIVVHIEPTPAALLHPVVLHHVEMVRRVAPEWRVIGHCWLGELDLDASPDAIARSPYHEVRIIDAPMPEGQANANPHQPARLQDLITAVRHAQRAIDRTLPLLARETALPVPAAPAAKPRPAKKSAAVQSSV